MNILVTGASKGLGLKIAAKLLDEQHTIFGISRSKTNDIVDLQENYPDTFNWLPFDVSRIESIRDEIFKNWIGFDTRLHGLVNNAAYAYDDLSTNMNMEELEKMYKINVFAPFALSKFAIRHMLLHNTAGSLVHISSISVHTGYKGLSMYASTKGALEAYSKNIAREWGEKRIRSNCLVAGFMETEMSSTLSDDQKKKIFRRTSLKKGVDIQSVASTVNYLLSDASKSITGQNIFVDNGTI